MCSRCTWYIPGFWMEFSHVVFFALLFCIKISQNIYISMTHLMYIRNCSHLTFDIQSFKSSELTFVYVDILSLYFTWNSYKNSNVKYPLKCNGIFSSWLSYCGLLRIINGYMTFPEATTSSLQELARSNQKTMHTGIQVTNAQCQLRIFYLSRCPIHNKWPLVNKLHMRDYFNHRKLFIS